MEQEVQVLGAPRQSRASAHLGSVTVSRGPAEAVTEAMVDAPVMEAPEAQAETLGRYS